MHGNICLGLVDDVVVVTLERAVVVDSEDMRKKIEIQLTGDKS